MKLFLSLTLIGAALTSFPPLAAQSRPHPRPQLARKRWQPVASSTVCTIATLPTCTARAALAPPGNGQRVLLQFGEPTGDATLLVNGAPASGVQRGADITGALRDGKEQEIAVRGINAQRLLAGAWLEIVPEQFIIRVLADTVPTAEALSILVSATAPVQVEIELRDGLQILAAAKGASGERLWLKPERLRLWTPTDPFLYQLHVRLASGDEVDSYAALRTLAVGRDAKGITRTLLNGRPHYFHGVMAAGAPAPASLRKLGFDTVRQPAVAPDRWYTECDRAGLLVWQDLPAPAPEDTAATFRRNTLNLLEDLRVYPSIALWTLFNEGNGQQTIGLDAARSLAGDITRLDTNRLVSGASGWFDTANGQIHAMHFSPGPAFFDPGPRRASVLARFGELTAPSRVELRRAYRELMGKLNLLRALGLSGSIYVPAAGAPLVGQLGEDWLAALHHRFLAATPSVEPLAGGDEPWEFTLAESGAAREGWRTGAGSFGSALRGVQPGTPWTAAALRLRRTFTWKGNPGELYLVYWALRGAVLDVKLNGQPVLHAPGDGAEASLFLPLQSHPALRDGVNQISIDARRAPNSPHAAFDARLISVNGDKLGFADPEASRPPEYPLTAIDTGSPQLAMLAPHFTEVRSPRGRPGSLPPSLPFFRDLGNATPEQVYYALLSAPKDGFDGVAVRAVPGGALNLRNIQAWFKQTSGTYPVLHLTGLTLASFDRKGANATLLFQTTPENPRPADAVALTGFPGDAASWRAHLQLLMQAAQSHWPLHVEPATPSLFAYATYLLGVESKSAASPVRLTLPLADLDEYYFRPIGEPQETVAASRVDQMKASGTQIYHRRFANGIVAVNPSGSAQTLRLDTALADPTTRQVSQAFVMPPRSALILLRPGALATQ